MIGTRTWSPQRKAAVAAALALLLWVPQGISTNEQPVVTGHSTFYNGEDYDPCLASIAGIMRTQVLWFNDQVLVERYGGRGTFVYITENGAPNPTPGHRKWLYSEGTVYDFVDPNGVAWHVEELYMFRNTNADVDAGVRLDGDPGGDDFQVNQSGRTRASLGQDRWYVWVVELSPFPIHDQFAGSPSSPYYHDAYNFVNLVDTCKFHRTSQTNWNASRGLDFNITHEGQDLQPGHGHPLNEDPHQHESFRANIWLGSRPNILVAGASEDSAVFASQWATNPNNHATGNAQNTPGAYGPDTEEYYRPPERDTQELP